MTFCENFMETIYAWKPELNKLTESPDVIAAIKSLDNDETLETRETIQDALSIIRAKGIA